MLGFALSRDEGLGAIVRRNMRTIRLVALPIVLVTAILVWFNWFPDPTRLPEPKLLFLNGKSFLTPMRLIQFLALAAVFSAAYPYFAPWVPWLTEFLSSLRSQFAQRLLRCVAVELDWANRPLSLHGLASS